MLLMLVAGVTTLAGYSLEWGASGHRREAERELLRIGAEFERALIAYAASRPANDPALAGPMSLDLLLKDDRLPQSRRYLRKIYRDPMTSLEAWGTIRGPGGTILGIHSLATGRPLKQKRFPASYFHMEDAESYADWVFGLPQARAFQPSSKQQAPSQERPITTTVVPQTPSSGVPS